VTTLVIAEVGSVHDGSYGNARCLIDLGAEVGADVVKFQTHIAAAETLRNAPMPPFFKGEPRFEYFERTGFSKEQWDGLKRQCESQDVEFMSSPFSEEAVDLLEEIGVSRYKIPSGEVTNLPLLDLVAGTGKPVLLSSGMSSWAELDAAVETILRRHSHLTVMQCSSEYPCSYERVGLNVMLEMRARYELPVGLSDHTMTNYAAFAAVSLGASVVEKHLTFSRAMYGSDARHSLLPEEFADLVQGIRAIDVMRSTEIDKDEIDRYQVMKETFQKSVVAVHDIEEGETLTREHLGIRKPGTGIPPSRLGELIGRKAARPISQNTLLSTADYR
jgi:N,N'-diacetyllegionaminate synthase